MKKKHKKEEEGGGDEDDEEEGRGGREVNMTGSSLFFVSSDFSSTKIIRQTL